MTVKTCTHECPVCGTGHYSEKKVSFRAKCRKCERAVKLQYNPKITMKVVIKE